MKTIQEYLSDVCIEVEEKESISYVELMMDNHRCIEYGGIQYYIPEDNQFGEDEIINDFLVGNYLVE